MINQKIIKKAISEAEKSNHRYRLGAVVFKGSRVLSASYNSIRHYRKLKPKFKKWYDSLHAEQSAIIRAKKDVNGYNILVIRIGKTGNLQLAKPCKYCQNYIDFVGIKKIFYSDKNGEIKMIKI